MNLHISKHTSLFTILFLFLKEITPTILKYKILTGLLLTVKGKIGIQGNLRKRKIVLALGRYSFFTMPLIHVYHKVNLQTASGLVSIRGNLVF